MDDVLKERLIAQFRAYLDETSNEMPMAPDHESEASFSLFAELAGLKNEVKRESRQVKEALDQFKAVFETLKADNATLSQELEQRRGGEKDLRRKTLHPLLLQLLELHDRLEAAVKLTSPRRNLLARFCRRQSRFIESLQEGQGMMLRRLQRLLADYGVRPMEVLDKPLDPHTMRVIEVESRPELAQGMVTAELRKGFFWDDELLRTAEVKVNKRDEKQ